jgi:carboxyl-terminal processing protease
MEAYREDARSIEKLINDNYAYLDRFPNGAMPVSPKLRAEAERVSDKRSLLRFAEHMLLALADHHAITGSSTQESWAVVPSYSDLWVEKHGTEFVIEAVRKNSPAERAGIRPGDRLLAVEGVPIGRAVASFWADLGLPPTDQRAGFAARMLAAGKRVSPRKLTLRRARGKAREVELESLYSLARTDRPPLQSSRAGSDLVIRFNDSLGSDATIAAFDAVMARAKPKQRIVIDLTDTPSGGNTVVARAIMGWFVSAPRPYQVHDLPAEKRRTGIARQWVEQVLPREGKHHEGPVVVKVGRWTGSMGEGLAIGFHALGGEVVGHRMAGLLGAIYDHRLENSGLVLKLPTERLLAVDGTPRESFVPKRRDQPLTQK